MKKYILAALFSAAVFSFSCNNPDNRDNKSSDSVVASGNTDSVGSQPIQPVPGSGNAGNPTDTIARNNDQPIRTDSVIKH